MIVAPSIPPNKIAGVGLWIDPSDMSTINSGGVISDGTAITSVKDKIGGISFTGTATFKKDAVVSGYNSILFNGTSNVLTGADSPACSGTSRSAYAVFKFVSGLDASVRYFVTIRDAAKPTGNANFAISFFGTSTGYRIFECNAAQGVAYDNQTLLSTSGIQLMCSRRNIANIGRFSLSNLFHRSSASGSIADPTSSNYLHLGSSSSSAGNANVHLCELIMGNSFISEKDHAQVRKYLFNRWGV